MWSAIWFLAPHSYAVVVVMLQLCREERIVKTTSKVSQWDSNNIAKQGPMLYLR